MANQIGDYGELLKEVELKICCDFIDKMAVMKQKLTELRHSITDLDSDIDLMKVKIGELDVP